jgi:hypothetical protein
LSGLGAGAENVAVSSAGEGLAVSLALLTCLDAGLGAFLGSGLEIEPSLSEDASDSEDEETARVSYDVENWYLGRRVYPRSWPSYSFSLTSLGLSLEEPL